MSYTCKTCNTAVTSKSNHMQSSTHLANIQSEIKATKVGGKNSIEYTLACTNCTTTVLDADNNVIIEYEQCSNNCCTYCYNCLDSFRRCNGCIDSGCLDGCVEPYIKLTRRDTGEIVEVCMKNLSIICKGKCGELVSEDDTFYDICSDCLQTQVHEGKYATECYCCTVCDKLLYDEKISGPAVGFNECNSCRSQICYDCLNGVVYENDDACQLCC